MVDSAGAAGRIDTLGTKAILQPIFTMKEPRSVKCHYMFFFKIIKK